MDIAKPTRVEKLPLPSLIPSPRELPVSHPAIVNHGPVTIVGREAQNRQSDPESVFHPIHCLPDELMTAIFMHCVRLWMGDVHEPDEDVSECLAVHPENVRWVLTGVCYRWRDIAVSLPQLWTYIHISEGSLHLRSRCAYRVALCIERSQGHLLTLNFTNVKSIRTHPVLPILKASAHLWERLSLISSTPSFFKGFAGVMFLNLRVIWIFDKGRLDMLSVSLSMVPVLAVETNRDIASTMVLPWFQLTSFVGDSNNLYYSNQLSGMSSLQTLELSAPLALTRVLSLPNLSSLTVTGCEDHATLHNLFSLLDLPALSSLTITVILFNGEPSLVIPTFCHPPRNLTKVTVTSNFHSIAQTDTRVELLDFLSQACQVEELVLSSQEFTEDFITSLTIASHSQIVLLPRLRILNLAECKHTLGFPCWERCRCHRTLGFDVSHLCTMLESRRFAGVSVGSDGTPRSIAAIQVIRVLRRLYYDYSEAWKRTRAIFKVECGVTTNDVHDYGKLVAV